MVINGNGKSEVAFLESKFNYFTRQEDWFLVKKVSDGRRTFRQERKIPNEIGERLWRKL
ncbi:MAG: hypothetical protein QW156_04400 [Candidatus Aenigmatarchaeota archaeon]